ncbi:MAG: T9SS type A sorting domain-containing protein [Bacteroidota bacterium]
MKNRYILALILFVTVGFWGNLQAQGVDRDPALMPGVSDSYLTNLPGYIAPTHPPVKLNSTYSYGPEAMWDQQFKIDVETPAGIGGLAGAVYTGTEFWVSAWQTDTIYRFTTMGALVEKFRISTGAGTWLSNTRAMTSDGQYVYIVNNTDTVFKVNPATRTLARTFRSTSSGNMRFLTYDSTAAGGAGGFFTGNFNTDIYQIDTNGVNLRTIGNMVGGKYGAAVDNFSTGGPYLWIFHQAGGTENALITQFDVTSGQPTGVTRNVGNEFGVGGNDLAGGLFISSDIVPGETTLGGLVQAAGEEDFLFGYELNFTPINVDASVRDITLIPGFAQVPVSQERNGVLQGTVDNFGQLTIDVDVILTVERDGVLTFSDTTSYTNLANASSQTFFFGPFPYGGKGNYEVKVSANTGTNMDQVPDNNEISSFISIGDSVYARDNGVSTGTGYLVSGVAQGYAATTYEISKDVLIKAIDLELEAPTNNDTTFGALFSTSLGTPTAGPPQFVTPQTLVNANQNSYRLEFNPPVPVTAGSVWAAAVFEDTDGISIRQSANIFTPGTNFFTTDLVNFAWNGSNIATARFIRLVVEDTSATPTSIDRYDFLGIEALQVYPVPASQELNVNLTLNQPEPAKVTLMDIQGREVLNRQLGTFQQQAVKLDVANLNAGTYLLRVSTSKGAVDRKVIIR